MHKLITSRGSLVSAQDLIKAYKNKHPGLRILNTTVGRPIADMDNNAVYLKERIPGATMVDIDEVADKSNPSLSHQTPKEREFKQFMEKYDVSNKDEVVLYDDNTVAGACKFWSTFQQHGKRAYVLDGGLNAWKKAGGPIEIGQPTWVHRHLDKKFYDYKLDASKQLDYNDINSISYLIRHKEIDYNIVDARSGQRFRSEAPEPRKECRSGNIPGSKNVFFKDLLNADGTFKSNEEIRDIFEKANVDLSKNMALSCGSSVSASLLSFALDLIGHSKDRYIYGGSWAEFGSKPQMEDNQIEKEALPKAKWHKNFTQAMKK